MEKLGDAIDGSASNVRDVKSDLVATKQELKNDIQLMDSEMKSSSSTGKAAADELEKARALRRRLIEWLEDAPEERLNGTSSAADGEAADAMLAALGYSGGKSVQGEVYWDPETADPGWKTNPWHRVMDFDDVTPAEAKGLLQR